MIKIKHKTILLMIGLILAATLVQGATNFYSTGGLMQSLNVSGQLNVVDLNVTGKWGVSYLNVTSIYTTELNVTGTKALRVYLSSGGEAAMRIYQIGTGELQEWWNSTTRMAYVHNNGTFYSNGGFVDTTPAFNKEESVKDAVFTFDQKDGHIDDDNLHPFLQADCEAKYIENGTVITEQRKCRDIGATATLSMEGIKDLYEEVDYLKQELCKKDNSYGFCGQVQQMGN